MYIKIYYYHTIIGDIMFDGTLNVLIKGFLSLIFLFFVIKLLGKKQISQLNIFDYVIGISLGNIAAEMTVNDDITIINAFVAMAIYGLVSLFVSFITSKSIIARRFISGVPVVIIEHGKISREQLKRVKLDINDLLQDAREDGIFDITEVEYAIMEVSGKVTFLLKSDYDTVTKSDLKIHSKNKGLVANLVMDGNIMKKNLEAIGKNEVWLLKKIKEKNVKIEDIFLLTYDNSDKMTIYPNNYQVGNGMLE